MYLYFNYYFHFNTLLLQPRINSITNICIFYNFFRLDRRGTRADVVKKGFQKQLGIGSPAEKTRDFPHKKTARQNYRAA